MFSFLRQINLFFWGGPMMLLLMGTHLYFTFSLRFIQRKVFRGIRLSGRSLTVLTTTLAATLGTGNIIGVGTAVFMGGPGAIFWCWLTGLFGMATTYAESYLSLRYRDEKTGLGGPMILLEKMSAAKAHSFAPRTMSSPFPKNNMLANTYALCICLSAFCIGGMTQSGAITVAVTSTFHLPAWTAAIATLLVVGPVLFLGMRTIEIFLEKLVPAMGFFFLGSCFLLLYFGRDLLLPALETIWKSAFSPAAFGGGSLGYSVSQAIRHGVARGLYTNEAGLGTAGIIAASTHTKSGDSNTYMQTPEEGALISMCATFFDTVILCAITGIALTIFLLRFPNALPNLTGSSLISAAFGSLPFWGAEILGLSIICFALATMIGWSYIGNHAALYIRGSKQGQLKTPSYSANGKQPHCKKQNGAAGYKLLYLLSVLSGSLVTFDFIWELTDFINLFLAFPCIYALLALRKNVH